ncbi:hypothetical protein FXO37_02238 [Capsicum annuum]|nr:hypothetical protein FXO37_02238 [Capsicum annuum]
MDYRMADMRKITNKTLGLDYKMVMFRWIAERIATYDKHATWVAGGIRDSLQIKKSSITFDGKAWWTISYHRICLTTSDDILSPIRAVMIVGFIHRFVIDVGCVDRVGDLVGYICCKSQQHRTWSTELDKRQDQDMVSGSGRLRDIATDTERVDDVPPPIIDPILIGTVDNESGT